MTTDKQHGAGRKYIIWCNEGTKPAFYPWLAAFERDILYCVSEIESLCGTSFTGLSGSWPIHPVERAKEDPEAVIILAMHEIQGVAEVATRLRLPQVIANNPYLASTWNFSVHTHGSEDKTSALRFLEQAAGIVEWSLAHKEETYALYDTQDTHTRTMLDYLFEERINLYRNILNYDFPFLESEYYHDRSLAPQGDITYVSCGAYTGRDTLHMHALFRDRLKKIIAVEPVPESFEILKYTLEKAGLAERCRFINGLTSDAYNEKEEFSFYTGSGEKTVVIPAYPVDDLIAGQDIQGDLVIQMDVEGADLEVLQGMEKTIRDRHPYLAIACYHKTEDVLRLPRYVQSINPDYTFHISQGCHTVCYAVPTKGAANRRTAGHGTIPEAERIEREAFVAGLRRTRDMLLNSGDSPVASQPGEAPIPEAERIEREAFVAGLRRTRDMLLNSGDSPVASQPGEDPIPEAVQPKRGMVAELLRRPVKRLYRAYATREKRLIAEAVSEILRSYEIREK